MCWALPHIAMCSLDIEQLPDVVNYELPNVPEDYVAPLWSYWLR